MMTGLSGGARAFADRGVRCALLLTAVLLAPFAAAVEFDDLANRVGVEQPDFLPVDEAFAFDSMRNGDRVTVFWSIADGYYLYRRMLRFELEGEPAGVSLGEPVLPEGDIKEDEYFGESEVYHHDLSVDIPLALAQGAEGTLRVRYQGCAEAGLCYPPEWRTVQLSAGGVVTGSVVPAAAAGAASGPTAGPAPGDGLAEGLASGSLAWTLALFFVAGIGLAFTPCVLPMVPILSSIIVGQGDAVSRGRSAALSAAYVGGMSITYACIGVVMGLFGASMNLQAAFQAPGVIIATALLFVVFAGSMFGLYELQLPEGLRNRLDALNRKQSGGQLGGVVLMGAISSLVVSPCVTAPLASALIYISATGDAVIGGLALWLLGLGMGVPLMVVGIGGGELLPRAGAWMNAVRGAFGVVMLGMAVWLLGRIVPGPVSLALWAALAMAVGVWLGALDMERRQGAAVLGKAAGAFSLVYGVLLLIGTSMGAGDPLRPLAPLAAGGAGGTTAVASGPAYIPVDSLEDLSARLQVASAAGRPVMLDFYADWCVACKIMEHEVFPQPEVMARLGDFDVLRADVTANAAQHKALLERFGLFGPPAIIFFDPEGAELSSFRLQGELGERAFLAHLEALLGARA